MVREIPATRTRFHTVLSLLLLAAATFVLLLGSAENASAKPLCQGEKPTIKGTPDGETIKGTDEADVIRARAGNDTILGLGGNDLVCLGKGADNADGAEGNDSVNGGEGNDQANGGGGNDRLVMHTGDDTVNGEAGIDECRSDKHSNCEADLRVNVTGPGQVTHGDDTVYTFNVSLRNNGPTDSVNSRVDLTLPASSAPKPVRARRLAPAGLGTVEYVPEESDPRCIQLDETTIRCAFGGRAAGSVVDADFALRFPDCASPATTRTLQRGVVFLPTAGITGRASDAGTIDPVGNNDADTHTFGYQLAPVCFG